MTNTNDYILVAYFAGEPEFRILSNFARTPFELDGELYASIEGWWQGLKTSDEGNRAHIATMHGTEAKRAGQSLRPSGTNFLYNGNVYKVGSEAHHLLLERALRAKFNQNLDAADALMATGTLPLKHMLVNKFKQLVPGDSPSLPAVTFENMLMKIRKELQDNTFTEYMKLPKGLI